MARLLSIDFGKKRTGIAVTDDFQIIASGLTTVDTEQLLPFLKDYFSKENVEKVIIGEPKRLNNEPSEVVPLLNSFIEKFKQSFPTMPVERIDERFTSKMAFQTMIDSGLKKKQRQNKALIDEIAATIILQDYMRK
ncbi:MAG: Holliday junction resolvase RuvX [Myroides sp.]|jgi:putative Holliday junction resolvase|uniref:Putative pre-16S rRNA nuclease n=1 Tax=Myroides marinus TaxID=703342 RepID=A0A161URI1_9FLAO|nr:Holliday junction resolvase RuvX [Myroides marinus]MDR0194685.1 Holliday junction resolvase RuvX [Myroides sp.]KZE80271.1 crossover junction endodeoxyribonuclease RuvA [Myroides marinus]MDM1370244.1 Holliday junction resolvase RuvX [Myroides marinus]MDM1373391.1 Holliday junction resolvase RuvX [Myroides marinus]MDM1377239.1 Holliday junction resolvase RuvX [Myroides marinus]